MDFVILKAACMKKCGHHPWFRLCIDEVVSHDISWIFRVSIKIFYGLKSSNDHKNISIILGPSKAVLLPFCFAL